MKTIHKIGLIGAMVEEVDKIIQHMDRRTTIIKAGLQFYEGRIHQHEVVVVQCGVGKVNAAVCSQIMIDQFHTDLVLFTGVAGALHPALDIGDIVVSTECMHHDMDATALGFARGEIPYAPISVFPSDEHISALAYECSQQLFPGRVRRGRIVSGDQFIADRDEVRMLHEELDGVCTEMEGAAVAQVCHMNSIPHVIIRSMSDRANGDAPANFQQFCILAADHSYQIIECILRSLAVR